MYESKALYTETTRSSFMFCYSVQTLRDKWQAKYACKQQTYQVLVFRTSKIEHFLHRRILRDVTISARSDSAESMPISLQGRVSSYHCFGDLSLR